MRRAVMINIIINNETVCVERQRDRERKTQTEGEREKRERNEVTGSLCVRACVCVWREREQWRDRRV